jgi:ferric-dicitrate binding protein FerR (iron transport regulator)
VFTSSRLADVVEEFNRYNVRQIRVAPGPLEELHISGVYVSTDPESLLTFLRAQPHIAVVEEDTEIRIAPK